MLTVQQQLELFTAPTPPTWLTTYAEYCVDPVGFLNRFRGKWGFSSDELKRYLLERPQLIEAYLQTCTSFDLKHDKVIIAREGDEYLVFAIDHGVRRGIEKFRDPLAAAIRWLEYRFMN